MKNSWREITNIFFPAIFSPLFEYLTSWSEMDLSHFHQPKGYAKWLYNHFNRPPPPCNQVNHLPTASPIKSDYVICEPLAKQTSNMMYLKYKCKKYKTEHHLKFWTQYYGSVYLKHHSIICYNLIWKGSVFLQYQRKEVLKIWSSK